MPSKKSSPKDSAKSKSAAEIAEAAMPGWKAVPKEEETRSLDARTFVSPDATLPSLTELRKKYLGEAEDLSDVRPKHLAAEDDTEVVTLSSGPHKKKVGVKGGKVVWWQG